MYLFPLDCLPGFGLLICSLSTPVWTLVSPPVSPCCLCNSSSPYIKLCRGTKMISSWSYNTGSNTQLIETFKELISTTKIKTVIKTVVFDRVNLYKTNWRSKVCETEKCVTAKTFDHSCIWLIKHILIPILFNSRCKPKDQKAKTWASGCTASLMNCNFIMSCFLTKAGSFGQKKL